MVLELLLPRVGGVIPCSSLSLVVVVAFCAADDFDNVFVWMEWSEVVGAEGWVPPFVLLAWFLSFL